MKYSFNYKQFLKALVLVLCAAIIFWVVLSWAEVAFHNVLNSVHEYSPMNFFKILAEARK